MQLHIEDLKLGLEHLKVMKELSSSDLSELICNKLIMNTEAVIELSKQQLSKEREQIEEAYNAGYAEIKYNREAYGSAYYLGKYKN